MGIDLLGGMDVGVFDGCLVAEELAFGCTGIMTAMEASGLGVSVMLLLLRYLQLRFPHPLIQPKL